MVGGNQHQIKTARSDIKASAARYPRSSRKEVRSDVLSLMLESHQLMPHNLRDVMVMTPVCDIVDDQPDDTYHDQREHY